MRETRVINIHNAHPRLRLDARARRVLRRAIALLDANGKKFRGGCPAGELSLAFLTDAALANLHAEFLGDPSTTDVITFEGAGGADAGAADTGDADTGDADASEADTRRAVAKNAVAKNADAKNADATGVDAMAGEICVSVDTALAYAKKHRRVFAEELLLYVVHGWLHLAGYDDLQPAKKRRMRAAEKRAMALLREAGALPEFALK